MTNSEVADIITINLELFGCYPGRRLIETSQALVVNKGINSHDDISRLGAAITQQIPNIKINITYWNGKFGDEFMMVLRWEFV